MGMTPPNPLILQAAPGGPPGAWPAPGAGGPAMVGQPACLCPHGLCHHPSVISAVTETPRSPPNHLSSPSAPGPLGLHTTTTLWGWVTPSEVRGTLGLSGCSAMPLNSTPWRLGAHTYPSVNADNPRMSPDSAKCPLGAGLSLVEMQVPTEADRTHGGRGQRGSAQPVLSSGGRESETGRRGEDTPGRARPEGPCGWTGVSLQAGARSRSGAELGSSTPVSSPLSLADPASLSPVFTSLPVATIPDDL